MIITEDISNHQDQLINLIDSFYEETIEQYKIINIDYLIKHNEIENNYCIALDKNNMIGYINYCIDEEYNKTIMINQLFVHRNFRNNGIATNLLNFLFDKYKHYNFCLGVVDSNLIAKKLYDRLGFKQPTFQFLFKGGSLN